MKPSQKQLITKIKAACSAGLKTSTLGGRRRVVFGKNAKGTYVRAGSSTYQITGVLLDAVTKRHRELLVEKGVNRLGYPHHLSAGQYNKPKWRGCPSHRACPFIAAALKP